MVAYTKPKQRKKEGIERLRGETDQIKFIHLRFESCNIQESKRKARRSINYLF